MNYKLPLLTILLLLLTGASAAKDDQDTTFQHLRLEYLKLYNSPQQSERFYDLSQQLMNHFQQEGNLKSYYKIRINEALYDTEHGSIYRAVKKANDILEDMKKDQIKEYGIVYTVLGTIFDTRGNYRMAGQYYRKALDAADKNDKGTLVSIYSRLSSLKSTREPKEAWEWNEQFGKMAADTPEHYKVYLVLKAQICFFLEDKQQFEDNYQKLEDFMQQHPQLDQNGMLLTKMMHEVVTGQYDKALQTMKADSIPHNAFDQLDIRIKAYQLMGMGEEALAVVNLRRDYRDSLNSDMIFDNINEINGEMELAKLNEKAAKEREMWLIVVIVLLLAALGLIIWRHLTRHRYRKKLIKQNKELEIALSRAEESDRMKDSFIEHVSHEIRTPLNIITGYAQIVTNPNYGLKEEERNRMLSDISKNTTELTYIVNELLEVAQNESREHYPTDDTIAVNSFCRKMLEKAEMKNNGRLELKFVTQLSDDYTFNSNEPVLGKVLEQLLSNALKFTKEGWVELKVHESPDLGLVRFIVTDTGIGIPAQYQEKIFERFFKVDTFKQGFGLGLTISRKIASLLGGSLALDKEYSGGARFILSLPCSHHNEENSEFTTIFQ